MTSAKTSVASELGFTLSKFCKTFDSPTIISPVGRNCKIRKQPLMMAYEGSESDRDNFGKFIYQFPPETKTLIRKLERILNKLYRQKLSLLFNETCFSERYECPGMTLKHLMMRLQSWSFREYKIPLRCLYSLGHLDYE